MDAKNRNTEKYRKEIKEKAFSFWNTDLEVIESGFLENGKDILSLPVTPPNGSIPAQGSVLLGKPAYLPKDS